MDIFQDVFDCSPKPVIAVNASGLIQYANSAAVDLFFPGGDFSGAQLAEINDSVNSSAKTTGKNYGTAEGEYWLQKLKGAEHSVSISPVNNAKSKGRDLFYLFIDDITGMKKKAQLLELLNTATEELGRVRDTTTALDKISTLIVPAFATWFSIDLVVNGKLEELVLAHEDPQMVEWARKYRAAYPVDMNDDSLRSKVIRTGIPSCIPVITDKMIRDSVTNPEQLELIQKINLQSLIIVAIFIKEKIAGIINFVSSVAGMHYDEAHVNFAKNFANHVGLALENTRLNEAAAREIEYRKKVEWDLGRTQAQLQSALSSGLVGTWVRDLRKNLLFADESLSEMFGQPYRPDGCDPEVYQQLILPDYQAITEEKRQQAIASSDLYEIEYQVDTPGGVKWFFARGKTEKDTDGHPLYFTGVMIDITARKQAEIVQKENEKMFRFLADTVPHKIWISAPDGKATYYNKGWYDYSGVTGLDNLKLIVWDMLHPDDRKVAAVEFPRVIESGEDMVMEQRLRRFDGHYRWHLARMSPHRDTAGNILLWVGSCTDIHEQKENEHRKDEFLAIASHELKTPLTNIKAYNQLLEAMPGSEYAGEFIEKSAKSIYRLERLVNDLLDVTKLNAGKVGYQFQPFSFRDMLLDSIGNLKYNASHKINLAMPDAITFTGDRMRLEQVMNNLLSNAIKYSPDSDKVLVRCTIEKDNIVVAVQDFGIGIAPENLHKLFDRYYRIDDSGTRFQGLGLGLFISSEILRHHRGSFWIESEPGKGSTFYFRLPLNTTEVPTAVQRTVDNYSDQHLSIFYNRPAKRLEVDWTGFQDLTSVKHGCLLMLEYLKLHPVDRIVNDNRNVYGTWSEASEWVGNIWFPLMEKAGLRYFAHILAINTFAQLSAKKSIDIMAGIITTQYFTDELSAKQWIESFPYPSYVD